jgi:hypothetical protein
MVCSIWDIQSTNGWTPNTTWTKLNMVEATLSCGDLQLR